MTAASRQGELVPSKQPYIIGTNDNTIGETENGVIHCIPDFLISLDADQTLVYREVIFTHKAVKVEHGYQKRIEEPAVVGVIVVKLEETHQYSAPQEKWTKADNIPQRQWTDYKLTGKTDAIVALLMERFINPIKNCSISVYFSQAGNVGGSDKDDGDEYSKYYRVEQVCWALLCIFLIACSHAVRTSWPLIQTWRGWKPCWKLFGMRLYSRYGAKLPTLLCLCRLIGAMCARRCP